MYVEFVTAYGAGLRAGTAPAPPPPPPRGSTRLRQGARRGNLAQRRAVFVHAPPRGEVVTVGAPARRSRDVRPMELAAAVTGKSYRRVAYMRCCCSFALFHSLVPVVHVTRGTSAWDRLPGSPARSRALMGPSCPPRVPCSHLGNVTQTQGALLAPGPCWASLAHPGALLAPGERPHRPREPCSLPGPAGPRSPPPPREPRPLPGPAWVLLARLGATLAPRLGRASLAFRETCPLPGTSLGLARPNQEPRSHLWNAWASPARYTTHWAPRARPGGPRRHAGPATVAHLVPVPVPVIHLCRDDDLSRYNVPVPVPTVSLRRASARAVTAPAP